MSPHREQSMYSTVASSCIAALLQQDRKARPTGVPAAQPHSPAAQPHRHQLVRRGAGATGDRRWVDEEQLHGRIRVKISHNDTITFGWRQGDILCGSMRHHGLLCVDESAVTGTHSIPSYAPQSQGHTIPLHATYMRVSVKRSMVMNDNDDCDSTDDHDTDRNAARDTDRDGGGGRGKI